MTIPANSITRLDVSYRILGVTYANTIHVRNSTELTTAEYIADVPQAGNRVITSILKFSNENVDVVQGRAKVITTPNLPTFTFAGTGSGVRTGTCQLPMHYLAMHYYMTQSATNWSRNTIRIGGQPVEQMKENTFQDSYVRACRAEFENLISDNNELTGIYDGNSVWKWVGSGKVGTSTVWSVPTKAQPAGQVFTLGSRNF